MILIVFQGDLIASLKFQVPFGVSFSAVLKSIVNFLRCAFFCPKGIFSFPEKVNNRFKKSFTLLAQLPTNGYFYITSISHG